MKSSDIALVIQRSPDFETYRQDAVKAVADLYALATQGGRIKAISAGARPVREADFGETRLRFVNQALQSAPSATWRFDLAARLAGDELITAVSGAKRAIVFFTSGGLGNSAFTTYSLLEIAAYLRNNSISFSPVVFGSGTADEDLAFLSSATGGRVYSLTSPGGMPEIVRDIRARVGSLYTIRYKSPTPPEFGERYIPLEIQVIVQRVSGRDEAGYYAPVATGTAGEIKKEQGFSRAQDRRNALNFSAALAASGA